MRASNYPRVDGQPRGKEERGRIAVSDCRKVALSRLN